MTVRSDFADVCNSNGSCAQLLRLQHVLDLTTLSRATIWRLVGSGNFPRPLQLSERAVAWREQDIVAWVQSRPVSRSRSAGGTGK